MKIRLLSLAVALLASAALFAQTKTETRSLAAFEKIAIAGGFDEVVLQEGAEEKIALEVSGVEAEKIITEVKDNTLLIHMKNGSYPDTKIRLTVTYRKLTDIRNSGSTDITSAATIRGETLTVHSSGSGDFNATLDVRKLKINISGSSDMKFSGTADDQAIAISGSGDVNAGELKGATADVAISGTGDVRLNVSGRVKTSVSGSGQVENKG